MGLNKFDRQYEITVQTLTGTTIVIRPPFTLDFNITRNTLADANVGSFKLYNLAKETRNLLRKDQDDFDNNKSIIVKAGYGKNLSQIFRGNISKAFSVRQGTDFITSLDCFDGGFALVNSTVDQTFPDGTPQRSIIKSVVSALQASGVSPGAIGDFPGQITRGNVVSGKAGELLKEMSGDAMFIDNEKVHVLLDGEALDLPIFSINPGSGLLNTPTREFSFINLEMIFEPQIQTGQRVLLTSFTDDGFNGLYKVHAIQHAGMISPSVAGRVISTFGMQPGSFIPVSEEPS